MPGSAVDRNSPRPAWDLLRDENCHSRRYLAPILDRRHRAPGGRRDAQTWGPGWRCGRLKARVKGALPVGHERRCVDGIEPGSEMRPGERVPTDAGERIGIRRGREEEGCQAREAMRSAGMDHERTFRLRARRSLPHARRLEATAKTYARFSRGGGSRSSPGRPPDAALFESRPAWGGVRPSRSLRVPS